MFSIKNLTQRLMLARQLKSAEPEERAAAAEALGDIGNPADVKILAAALKDEDLHVRKAAAGALKRIEDPSVVPALIEALTDPSAQGGAWEVEILAALEFFHDPRSVSACIGALSCPDPKVRRAAAHTLGIFEDASAVPQLLQALQDESNEVARDAAYALAEIGRPAVEGLLRIMEESSVPARVAAASALSIIGDRSAIPALTASLKDKDSYLQIAAAKALACFHDPAVIPPLIAALDESSTAAFYYGVRDEASTALLKIGRAAILPLIEALQTATTPGRLSILKLLAEMPDPRSFDAVAALLQDPEPEVRKAALGFLPKVDAGRVLEYLPSLLDDSDVNLRLHAGEMLLNRGWQPDSPMDRARLAIALGRYSQALEEGDPGFTLLLNRLEDQEPTVRRDVLLALAPLKNESLLPCLQACALNESEPYVQHALFAAMETCGSPAVGSLVALLEEGRWGLRRQALQSLSKLGWEPQTVTQHLYRALASGDTKAAAALGAPVLEALQQALQDGDQEIQQTAAAALEQIAKDSAQSI